MAYRILIVDDEPEMVQMLSRFLSRSGYEIIPAFTGEEAVASIKAHPDIILLDINMPGMDGISVCKEVRDKIGCPILFLTAKDQEADKIEGFTAGGDDYITKPFSLAELKVRIDAHLRLNTCPELRESILIISNSLRRKCMDSPQTRTSCAE